MKHWIAAAPALAGLLALLLPAPASAALPELSIAPLRYDAQLESGHPKDGFIDASNPTGSTIHVQFQVQAFRQVNDQGELQFYDDARIASAITPAVTEFDIGPRQAIRTRFTIDPSKLGPGGAYGVIFLRTTDPTEDPNQINTSARVGTLLILNVGSGGTTTGRLTGLTAPRFVYGGSSIATSFGYTNTGHTKVSLAFAPALAATTTWSAAQKLTGPFVFPGRTRRQSVSLPASNRLGPVEIKIADATGGSATATRWVFVVTGYWVWAAPLIVVLLLAISWLIWSRLPHSPFSPSRRQNKPSKVRKPQARV